MRHVTTTQIASHQRNTNATNASVEAAASLVNATGTDRTREVAVGATLTISATGGAPLWQATKSNGAPGRDLTHRLKNVVVDGATYPIQHDDRGRISTAPDLDLTYDVFNRLVGAQKGAQWEVYLYDGDGLMVGRQDGTGDLELYGWDGNHMIGAYEDNGAPKWEAVFGAGQDELLAYYDYMNGRDVLPVRDWRNNLVSAFDTGSQSLFGYAEYSPEGRVTTFDNTGVVMCQEEGSGTVCPMPGELPFAFNGQWRSSLTGLSYMRNRWYSPRLGQFMSHDPLHYVDSVNLYSFAGFDPINSWDPMGLSGGSLTETKIEDQLEDLTKDEEKPPADKPNDPVDEFREGVKEYPMMDDWDLFLEPDTWRLAAEGYTNEVKRRMNNPVETFSPSSFSDLYAGLEGLVHAATHAHDVIVDGDFKAMGRLAPELLLKVLAVGILHKVGGSATITGESSSIKKLQFPGKDPTKAPAGFEWRGKAGAVKGSKDGNYYNPKTGESLRPDLDHADPVGPHWDYKDSNNNWFRIGPDGSHTPKK